MTAVTPKTTQDNVEPPVRVWPALPWKQKAVTITLTALVVLAGFGAVGYGIASGGEMFIIGGGVGAAGGLLVGAVVLCVQKHYWERKCRYESIDMHLKEDKQVKNDIPFLQIEGSHLLKSLDFNQWTRVPLGNGRWGIATRVGKAIEMSEHISNSYIACTAIKGENTLYQPTYLEPGKACVVKNEGRWVIVSSALPNITSAEGCIDVSEPIPEDQIEEYKKRSPYCDYTFIEGVTNVRMGDYMKYAALIFSDK